MIIVIFTIPSTREGILSILGYVSTNDELGAGYIPNLLQEMTLNAKMIGQANCQVLFRTFFIRTISWHLYYIVMDGLPLDLW